jgi:tetratricopeptide (TPR) repeat protein
MLAFALLPASAWAAGPSKAEKLCRDRYENGTPKEIGKACGNCLEKDPKNTACRQALQFLNSRPKLTPTDWAGQPLTGAMREAQQHYLSGVIYFQKGDYEKALAEWKLSKELDPSNQDAQAGIDRLQKLYGVPSK